MEWRTLTREQLRQVYASDLKTAFPPSELKPLWAMERLWQAGRYKPCGLFDAERLLGVCLLWLGESGWALLDYLCVSAACRNGGLGGTILRMAKEAEPDTVIFGESEAPEDAPDPAQAARRLAFYQRCGARTAGYDTELFGVHYKTLYFANRDVEDGMLLRQHRLIYETDLPQQICDAYVRIPWDGTPGRQVAWME